MGCYTRRILDVGVAAAADPRGAANVSNVQV